MSVLPWYENPFRLISWLEMNKFAAEEFFKLGKIMNVMLNINEQWIRDHPGDNLKENAVPVMQGFFQQALELSTQIGLKISAKTLVAAIDSVREGMEYSEISYWIKAAGGTMEREMDGQLFLYVPSHRSDFFDPIKPLFGSDFANHFGSAERDSRKAGVCFAVGQYTASVFHLMRVMEICLRAAEDSLQLPPSMDRNWGTMLERWHSAKIVTFPSSIPIYKAHESFYKDIRATLCAVKDAWRNPTMHVERDYEEEEAEEVLVSVRSFARKLSAQLDEKGQFR